MPSDHFEACFIRNLLFFVRQSKPNTRAANEVM